MYFPISNNTTDKIDVRVVEKRKQITKSGALKTTSGRLNLFIDYLNLRIERKRVTSLILSSIDDINTRSGFRVTSIYSAEQVVECVPMTNMIGHFTSKQGSLSTW